jgi:hypothetical protein
MPTEMQLGRVGFHLVGLVRVFLFQTKDVLKAPTEEQHRVLTILVILLPILATGLRGTNY